MSALRHLHRETPQRMIPRLFHTEPPTARLAAYTLGKQHARKRKQQSHGLGACVPLALLHDGKHTGRMYGRSAHVCPPTACIDRHCCFTGGCMGNFCHIWPINRAAAMYPNNQRLEAPKKPNYAKEELLCNDLSTPELARSKCRARL